MTDGGRAELLESFAGSSGHSFLKGLTDHPCYPIGDIADRLKRMVHPDFDVRDKAQQVLFQGGIEKDGGEDDEDPTHKKYPFVEFSWKVSPLIGDEAIVEKFTTLLRKNLKMLSKAIKL